MKSHRYNKLHCLHLEPSKVDFNPEISISTTAATTFRNMVNHFNIYSSLQLNSIYFMLLVIFTIQHKVCTSNRQKKKKTQWRCSTQQKPRKRWHTPLPSFFTLLFLTNPINITFSVSINNYSLVSTYSK